MRKSIQISFLLEAYRRGYRIDKVGVVTNPIGRILKLQKTKDGYYSFGIHFNGKKTRVLPHKLQAYQKYGDAMFEEGIVVRHYNSIRIDNSEDNILIGTASDNMMDKPKEQRIQDASNPTYNHKSILEDRAKGMTYSQLMSKYKIKSKGTISFIVNKSLEKDKL